MIFANRMSDQFLNHLQEFDLFWVLVAVKAIQELAVDGDHFYEFSFLQLQLLLFLL